MISSCPWECFDPPQKKSMLSSAAGSREAKLGGKNLSKGLCKDLAAFSRVNMRRICHGCRKICHGRGQKWYHPEMWLGCCATEMARSLGKLAQFYVGKLWHHSGQLALGKLIRSFGKSVRLLGNLVRLLGKIGWVCGKTGSAFRRIGGKNGSSCSFNSQLGLNLGVKQEAKLVSEGVRR